MTRLASRGIGKGPAGGRGVEGEAEAGVAGGGDGGRDAELGGDLSGERVGAAVAAEQRDDRGAVLGHRDHRRLGASCRRDGGRRPGSGCRWRRGR